MHLPFRLSGVDKNRLELGLTISRQGIEAFEGLLTVADIPGAGFVFTTNPPRFPMTTRNDTRV